jgi:beta-lactamase class A
MPQNNACQQQSGSDIQQSSNATGIVPYELPSGIQLTAGYDIQQNKVAAEIATTVSAVPFATTVS